MNCLHKSSVSWVLFNPFFSQHQFISFILCWIAYLIVCLCMTFKRNWIAHSHTPLHTIHIYVPPHFTSATYPPCVYRHEILKYNIVCVQLLCTFSNGTTGTDCNLGMTSHRDAQGAQAHSLNDNLNQGMQLWVHPLQSPSLLDPLQSNISDGVDMLS